VTAYRVATNPGDYQFAHALMRAEGVVEKQKITFPTILAYDDDNKVVGMLGTRIINRMIVAGPLILRGDQRRSFTAMRLFEFYENAMKNMGIKSFIFSTEIGHIFDKVVREKLELQPYAVDDGQNWYIRKLDYEHQSQGPRAEPGRDRASESPS